jgi:hypothetical protein
MHVIPRFGEERRHVAPGTVGFSVEDGFPARCGILVIVKVVKKVVKNNVVVSWKYKIN